MVDWTRDTAWTADERNIWNHFDQLAATFCGISSTIFTLVYVLGKDAPVQHSAAFLLLVCLVMNLWSLLVRYKQHYEYKRGLVYASVAAFLLARGLLEYLAMMS